MSHRSLFPPGIALAASLASAIIMPGAAQAEGRAVIMVHPSQSGPPVAFDNNNVLFVTAPSTAKAVNATSFNVSVIDLTTGAIIPNADFQLRATPGPMNGGHDHDNSSRPLGTLKPQSGNTGASGTTAIIYNAPETSGDVTVTLMCMLPNGNCVPTQGQITVAVGGLSELPPGDNYSLVGFTRLHTSNHFGTASLISALIGLADAYAEKYPGGILSYNDMSLITGGQFDINGTWAPPHKDHRLGKNCDFAQTLVPIARRNALRQMVYAQGMGIYDEVNHWHLTR